MSKHIEHVQALVAEIDLQAPYVAENEQFYQGRQPLAFLSAEARKLVKLDRIASNLCRLMVNSIAERIRVVGLTLNDRSNEDLFKTWRASDMDQRLGSMIREALAYGASYAIVWDTTGTRRPRVTPESVRNMTVARNPETGEITEAVKRWTAADGVHHVVWYGPTTIERYEASDATGSGLVLKDTIANPLGTPPVVEVLNVDLIGMLGVSEMDDLKPLVNALNKILADMLATSESYARPRRWAAGIELETDEDGEPVNPFPETNRMAVAEEATAKFGQWDAASLTAYDSAVKVLMAQIQAVSSLPGHYLGTLNGAPTSADGNRSAEASLAGRAEEKIKTFGPAIERIGQLLQGIKTGTDPLSHRVGVVTADPATRSEAQAADAAVKLHAEGLLSRNATLRRLGMTADEIKENDRELLQEQAMRLIEAPLEVPTAPEPAQITSGAQE